MITKTTINTILKQHGGIYKRNKQEYIEQLKNFIEQNYETGTLILLWTLGYSWDDAEVIYDEFKSSEK